MRIPMALFRRRTVRLRFTVLYGVLFLMSGTALLAIANLVTSGSMSSTAPVRPVPTENQQSALAEARAHIGQLQAQLADQNAAQSHQLLVGSAIALGIMAVVSVVLGNLVAGRVLRPLRTMTAATRRISADNLHERLAVPGPADEVKDLADTIDELLERLEGAFAAQRRFVADASHELRTPLTTMRASLDVAEAKPEPVPPQTTALAGRIRTELDQVDRLLEGFLVLARTQHGDLPDRAALSLDHIVSAALSARAADITAKDLTVYDSIGHDGARVLGSRTLLRRLADNLIDNAVGHNHHGGWIRVTTTGVGSASETDAEAGGVRLAVETGGPVLDQQQVAQLTQPFRRLGAERTGTGDGAGLGLSIVAAITAAHGGTVDLYAIPEGGLRVSISLPPAPQAAAHHPGREAVTT